MPIGKSPKMSREASNRFSRHCSGCPYPRKVSSHFRLTSLVKVLSNWPKPMTPTMAGLGKAPKFPNVGVYELFLRHYHHSKGNRFLEMVTHTLTKMAQGGIYDHLGGGFHRYSVDEKWLVPHFEKMLYDNAQLVRIYAQVYCVTGEPLFKQVVNETMTYLMREMLHTEGGFYSTQDADSEGEEGKFFVWTEEEISQILGEESSEIFCRIYDASEEGNFEEKNILHPILTLEQASKFFRRDLKEIESLVSDAKGKLFQEREKRIKPFRDEKILTSWNGLMLSGLAEAIKISRQPAYLDVANRTVDFIFTKLFRDSRLLHTYKSGTGKILGYLDDYAFLAAGLLDLFEASVNRVHLDRAVELAEIMLREFWDEAGGGFFYTGRSHERLVAQSKPILDGSIPSGNAVATQVLLRLYHYTGKEDYLKRAERILRAYYDAMENQPFGFAHMLAALDFYLQKPKEVVLVGDKKDPETAELLTKIHSLYLPNMTLQLASPDDSLEKISSLLAGKKQFEGKPTVYVCHNFTCSRPVVEWDELKPLLDA